MYYPDLDLDLDFVLKGLDSVDDRVEIVRVKLLSYISYYVKYTRLDPKNQSTKKT